MEFLGVNKIKKNKKITQNDKKKKKKKSLLMIKSVEKKFFSKYYFVNGRSLTSFTYKKNTKYLEKRSS